MPIAEHTLQTLEFPKIREHLAAHTSFSGSRELALSLRPATVPEQVAWRLRLTSETRRLLDEYPDATIGGARDIRTALQHAARGGLLEPSTLLEISNTLRSTRLLRRMLLRLNPEHYYQLPDLAQNLPDLPALETAIEQIVDDDGSIRDSASPALRRIRLEIRDSSNRLQERHAKQS
ncbi:MAG: endonuclease MutS2, partial [Chloroflexaceae bacterium]|nr:endonuclease MutS2 [Chloroflexaceae bacterium]